jgi:hypothetical protein
MTLKAKVRKVLEAREKGDPRYLMLLLAMAARLGTHPDVCSRWLQQTADAPDTGENQPAEAEASPL